MPNATSIFPKTEDKMRLLNAIRWSLTADFFPKKNKPTQSIAKIKTVQIVKFKCSRSGSTHQEIAVKKAKVMPVKINNWE